MKGFFESASMQKKERFLLSESFRKMYSHEEDSPYHISKQDSVSLLRETLQDLIWTTRQPTDIKILLNYFDLKKIPDLTQVVGRLVRDNKMDALKELLDRVERDERRGHSYRLAVPLYPSDIKTVLNTLAEDGNMEPDLWQFFTQRAIDETGHDNFDTMWKQKFGGNETLHRVIKRRKKEDQNFANFIDVEIERFRAMEEAYLNPSSSIKKRKK